MDVFSKQKRSEIMSKIGGKNTKPEIAVRKFLFANGFRFRIHGKKLPGNPDIVLPKHKTVVLVNGCFWHGHESKRCGLFKLPKSNVDFWDQKITNNRKRDARNIRKLKKLGWNVIVLWECALKIDKGYLILNRTKKKILDMI